MAFILRAARPALRGQSRRAMSTAGPAVTTSSPAPGVTMLKIASGPVNTLSRPVLTELIAALQTAAKDDATKAVVISSGLPKVFSAGLDIMELFRPKEEAFHAYMGLVADYFCTLYNHPKTTIAAITGAAPAGGCWTALQCDYRVMVDAPGAVIGLNETQLGIIAPFWFAEPMVAAIGQRKSEMMLQLGTLAPAKEALAAGLVDALAESPAAVDEAAVAAAKAWMRIPEEGRRTTKSYFRQALVDRVARNKAAAVGELWGAVNQPPVQEAMAKYLASLKDKSTSKPKQQ